MNTDLAKLPDSTLAYFAHKFEMKVGSLRGTTTTIGAKLLAQYQAKRAAVRLELERRRA
jgi:RecA/RadA recombinase